MRIYYPKQFMEVFSNDAMFSDPIMVNQFKYYPFTDCYDAYLKSNNSFHPGLYKILKNPDNFFPTNPILSVTVDCLQEGWTVIQSRGQFGNQPNYFNRTWAEYQTGFGIPGMHIALCA